MCREALLTGILLLLQAASGCIQPFCGVEACSISINSVVCRNSHFEKYSCFLGLVCLDTSQAASCSIKGVQAWVISACLSQAILCDVRGGRLHLQWKDLHDGGHFEQSDISFVAFCQLLGSLVSPGQRARAVVAALAQDLPREAARASTLMPC